jgi:hypothetical protein
MSEPIDLPVPQQRTRASRLRWAFPLAALVALVLPLGLNVRPAAAVTLGSRYSGQVAVTAVCQANGAGQPIFTLRSGDQVYAMVEVTNNPNHGAGGITRLPGGPVVFTNGPKTPAQWTQSGDANLVGCVEQPGMVLIVTYSVYRPLIVRAEMANVSTVFVS